MRSTATCVSFLLANCPSQPLQRGEIGGGGKGEKWKRKKGPPDLRGDIFWVRDSSCFVCFRRGTLHFRRGTLPPKRGEKGTTGGPRRDVGVWLKTKVPEWHLGNWNQKRTACGLPQLFDFEPRLFGSGSK